MESPRLDEMVWEVWKYVELNPGSSVPLIENWIRSRFRYRGEIEEVLRTPDFMIQTLEEKGYFDGDCDDVSTFTAALLIRLGFPARFVAIRTGENAGFNHVYVESNGYVIDPTVSKGTPYEDVRERMVLDV